MKKYHLTFLRDGKYCTEFTEATSIEIFIATEIELGREIHILYSRELSFEEFILAKELGL